MKFSPANVQKIHAQIMRYIIEITTLSGIVLLSGFQD
jgi:hypothetical protein